MVPAELAPRQRMVFVAERQRGRIGRSQLIVVGVSDRMIRRDVGAGTLHRRHQGVYVLGADVPVPLGEETAALLAVGEPVALAFDSAAALLEYPVSSPHLVHLAVPADRSPRSRPGIRIHRTIHFDPRDFTHRHGLPVTTPERALLDLTEDHDTWTVERCFDEALHRRLISPTKIRALAARHPTHPGAAVLLALADPSRARGMTRSEMERATLRLLRAANVSDPERDYPVEVFTLDFYWPQARYGIEFDSWQWHAGPWAFKRDRRKSARMKDLGIELDRITGEMLNDPVPLVARVVRELERRTRAGPAGDAEPWTAQA